MLRLLLYCSATDLRFWTNSLAKSPLQIFHICAAASVRVVVFYVQSFGAYVGFFVNGYALITIIIICMCIVY